MNYLFFKENINNISSIDFCNANFSKEIIYAIKNRLEFYSNKSVMNEISKNFSNLESIVFEMKDREENDDKTFLINKIKDNIKKYKENEYYRIRFPFYIDLDFKTKYKLFLYSCESALKEIDTILNNSKDIGKYKPNEKLLCIFYELKKNIEFTSSSHLSYITGTDKLLNNRNIDIVKNIDDLICPFVYINRRIDYKDTPFSKLDPEKDIYDILFNTTSILEDIFKTGINLDIDKISNELLNVELNNENEKFIKISYAIFSIYDIFINLIFEYIEDIQKVVYDFYNEITYGNYYETDDYDSVTEKYIPNKILLKLDFKDKYIQGNNISKEAIAIDEGHKENNVSLNDIDSNYKSKWLKLQKTLNEIFKIKIGKLNLKMGASFFKKWYGRVPSMYSRYGSEATIPENNMKDDPVEILTTSGVQYLNRLSEDAENIFNDLLNTCKKVTSAGNLMAKLNAVKDYCKQYPIEEGINTDPKTIERQIKNETSFRIAKAIMQDNNVYGYSINGIVENGKFPTCNHIVVSLFIDNPHEKPQSIPVSNIFSSPENILIFAKPEKLYIVETSYRRSMSKILNNFNYKTTSVVVKNMNKNYKMFTSNLVKQANVGAGMTSNEENGNGEDIKQAKKVAKAIEKGMVDAIDIVIEQKRRCIQCIGVMYDMMNRIQKLAKRCIAAMHEVEVNRSDTKFKSGINSGSLNRSVKSSNKEIQVNRNIENNIN